MIIFSPPQFEPNKRFEYSTAPIRLKALLAVHGVQRRVKPKAPRHPRSRQSRARFR
jgi:hypothetical protein